MKEFWALVGNTRRLKKIDSFRSTPWWKIYVGFFWLLALGGFCFGVYYGAIRPHALEAIMPVVLILTFIISMSVISREWSAQTVFWWLTLPYPRAELLAAKLVGAYFRFLKIVAWSLIVLAVFAVAGMLLNPALWSLSMLVGVAVRTARAYLLTVAVSPLAVTLGLFLAVTRHSRLRPLIPLIWVLMILLFLSYLPVSLVVAGLLGLPLAAVIFGVTSYILTEQTEV